jgi:protein-S-isoprenylcysteine O-methyltransferase Ste14
VVFRIVLPVLWTLLIAAIAANRWLVARQLGRDPIVIRRWNSPSRYRSLETVLLIGLAVLTADVALNAIWPAVVSERLAIGAIRNSRVVRSIGLAMLTAGLFLVAVAVRQMGISWRIGIDTDAPGPLVSRGVYARVRHPIYSGMLLGSMGIAGVTADALSIVVAVGAAIALPIQAGFEEAFLLSRYPQAYPLYLKRSGRFFPRLRRAR